MEAGEAAEQAAVGKKHRYADVGADSGSGGEGKGRGAGFGEGVGDGVWKQAARHPLAIGLPEQRSVATAHAERFGIAEQCTEHLSLSGEF